jgi:hypothetical protein
MPYELSFAKSLEAINRDQYFNDCYVNGEVVMKMLLPVLRNEYGEAKTDQEDWGWFAWFSAPGVGLAINVFGDNPDSAEFRGHLSSRVRREFFGVRLQTSLSVASDDMDNATNGNIENRKTEVKKLITTHKAEIDAICTLLTS